MQKETKLSEVTKKYPNCIRTFSGIYMNVLEPTLEMICIEDIAHALSMQCRFGGHLSKFYSVAQHSFMVASILDGVDKLQGLFHDASEAYLLDVPTPIKSRLTNYKDIEKELMILIAKKIGFDYPLSKNVKEADNTMLQFEWEVIMLQEKNIEYFACWSPEYAKKKFLETYNEIIKIK